MFVLIDTKALCTRQIKANRHKQRASCDSFKNSFDHFDFYPQSRGGIGAEIFHYAVLLFLCGSTPGLPRSTSSYRLLRQILGYCCRGMLVGIHSENAANEPPAPREYLFTDGGAVCQITDLGFVSRRLLCATLVKQSQFIYLFIYLFSHRIFS